MACVQKPRLMLKELGVIGLGYLAWIFDLLSRIFESWSQLFLFRVLNNPMLMEDPIAPPMFPISPKVKLSESLLLPPPKEHCLIRHIQLLLGHLFSKSKEPKALGPDIKSCPCWCYRSCRLGLNGLNLGTWSMLSRIFESWSQLFMV